MTKIVITLDITETDWLDPDHSTGLNVKGYNTVFDQLALMGDNINICKQADHG